MDLLDFLVVFSIGWFGGQWYMAWQLKRNITRIAEKYGMTFDEWSDSLNSVVKEAVQKVPKMITEYEGNSIYLYMKDTGNFVAQGNSLEELARIVKQEYETCIVTDKEQLVLFINGKVQTNLNESKTS
jgi:hypothetical protein